MTAAAWCRRDGTDLILSVLAQPRAKLSTFAGVTGNRVKIRLASPPVDGRANEELVRFLAAAFGVPKSRVHLQRGAGGRHKTVRIAQPTRRPEKLPPLPR